MSGLFYGIEIARRGLTASQRAISVTGHNVANADTDGFTRQRLNLESIYPQADGRFVGKFSVGGGVATRNIEQIRNSYIDKQLRGGYSTLTEWTTRSEELDFIQSILDETKKEGTLATAMGDFFASIGKLTTDVASGATRTNMQKNALKLCDKLNDYYRSLVDLQNNYNDSIESAVMDLNSRLESIARYNEQIQVYELSGQNANELRDRRNVLLDEVSKLTGMSYSVDSDDRLSVYVEGHKVVDHNSVITLKVKNNADGFHTVYFDDPSQTPDPLNPTADDIDIDFTGGKIKAYMDLRDGNAVENMGIPYIIDSLNKLARNMAEGFNKIHQKGWTIPYDGGGASQTGINFFDDQGGDYSKVTAGNITLSQAVKDSEFNIAGSGKPVDFTVEDNQAGNRDIALELYELTSSPDGAKTGVGGSYQDYYKTFVVQIGITGRAAAETAGSHTTIVANLEARKDSAAGVSIDEEMIGMISFHYAYSAASRVLTTLDEALDTLINGTGRVGR